LSRKLCFPASIEAWSRDFQELPDEAELRRQSRSQAGAWERGQRCERFADKEWDWVDCTSFELMERRGIRDALSLDHHFTQAGFTRLCD
jgi:predicted nucleic acid-binding protein